MRWVRWEMLGGSGNDGWECWVGMREINFGIGLGFGVCFCCMI